MGEFSQNPLVNREKPIASRCKGTSQMQRISRFDTMSHNLKRTTLNLWRDFYKDGSILKLAETYKIQAALIAK